MSLTAGTRLGPYHIVAPLGAGGMGEVYRARDTKLDRDVAIKILPELFSSDAERLARFAREAKTLASLNHPHIAQIYGFEQSGAISALVLELVEGQDLAQRIARGPIPLDEALDIAGQIADALEAAHEAGIVHRDLKPANIKLGADGTVKVLDFGLAKAPVSDTGVASSPTVTSLRPGFGEAGGLTQVGVIVGTAAYMAPEQARGRAVDRRADIWAFGVVVYEMLTGRACFAGETLSEVIASVMKDEPDFERLPPETPAPLRRLLHRCLQKDPRRRLSAIGDARWDLDESVAPPAAAATAPSGAVLRWAPWVVAAAAVAAAGWTLTMGRSAAPAEIDGHFTIELPVEAALVTDDTPRRSEGPLALSPDGRHLVYVGTSGASTLLFVRALGDMMPRPLTGTNGARHPFFSPDGQWVGFFADGALKKIALGGGTPATLAPARGSGASWGRDGTIVFAPNRQGLQAVKETGGTPRQVTTIDSAAGDDVHAWPQVLPGGAVLFAVISWSRETSDIFLADPASGRRRRVQENASFARYVPGASGSAGQLVFVKNGALVAAPFDPSGDGTAGAHVAVVDGVRHAQFDLSPAGTLAYVPGPSAAPNFAAVWVDRKGVATPINDLPRGYEDLHLSPDGRRVAFTIEESGPDSPAHVWLADTERRTLQRLTFDGYSRDPVWAPDGQSIVFGSRRGKDTFGLYVQRLDGRSPAELVWPSPDPIWPDPQSWGPDGTIVFTTKGRDTSDDIWTLSPATRSAKPWLNTPASEFGGHLSPDGRWMAYTSNESGQDELYVQPFPGPGAKRLVSQNGGGDGIWSRDGRELFYRRDEGFYSVKVETEPAFASSTPVLMFTGRYRETGRDFDVSRDGTRFVAMRAEEPRTTTRVNVILNWSRVLAARLSGTR